MVSKHNKPSREKTLSDKLTDFLSDQVRSGKFPVHSRLPTEQFMAEQYGVSRSVVREAISRLKSERLVETRQGSGTVILDPRGKQAFRLERIYNDPKRGVLRIIELRRGIEAETAALAAERRTTHQMDRINRALIRIEKAEVSGGDGVREDLAFHLEIAQATANPYYADLLEMLTQALEDAIRVTRGNEALRGELVASVHTEHEAIRLAIEKRDVESARAAAFTHMQNAQYRIMQSEPASWQLLSHDAAKRLARTRLKNIM